VLFKSIRRSNKCIRSYHDCKTIADIHYNFRSHHSPEHIGKMNAKDIGPVRQTAYQQNTIQIMPKLIWRILLCTCGVSFRSVLLHMFCFQDVNYISQRSLKRLTYNSNCMYHLFHQHFVTRHFANTQHVSFGFKNDDGFPKDLTLQTDC
jgi:hypothetical protein